MLCSLIFTDDEFYNGNEALFYLKIGADLGDDECIKLYKKISGLLSGCKPISSKSLRELLKFSDNVEESNSNKQTSDTNDIFCINSNSNKTTNDESDVPQNPNNMPNLNSSSDSKSSKKN